MIKRKDGLWLIYYEKAGTYIEGSGYFKTLTEAQAAEASILAKFTEPVQHLNTSSKEAEPHDKKDTSRVSSSVRGRKATK